MFFYISSVAFCFCFCNVECFVFFSVLIRNNVANIAMEIGLLKSVRSIWVYLLHLHMQPVTKYNKLEKYL